MIAGAGAFFVAAPMPAFAELYGDGKAPKVAQAASVANAKAIKFAKAGEESDAFKQAEAKRIARESGKPIAKASTEDDLARLGLKTYK